MKSGSIIASGKILFKTSDKRFEIIFSTNFFEIPNFYHIRYILFYYLKIISKIVRNLLISSAEKNLLVR